MSTSAPPVVLEQARAEYLEMPGLRLTPEQAARLWNVDRHESQQILAALVDDGLLQQDRSGAYRRRDCPRCS